MNRFRFDTVNHPEEGDVVVLSRKLTTLALVGVDSLVEVYRLDPSGVLMTAPVENGRVAWEHERDVDSMCPMGHWTLFYRWLELHLALSATSTDASKHPALDPTPEEAQSILNQIEEMWDIVFAIDMKEVA